jgi:uncharacterized ParB-like nuclease family protein
VVCLSYQLHRKNNRRIAVQISLGKIKDPIPKITKEQRVRGMVQIMECLFSKHCVQTPVLLKRVKINKN